MRYLVVSFEGDMYSSPNKMSCKERALYLLTRRDHGEFELWQKLLLKGFEEEEVQQAVIYCKKQGYLDDQRFARSQLDNILQKGMVKGEFVRNCNKNVLKMMRLIAH